jgi:PAS domain S-box-containing protein
MGEGLPVGAARARLLDAESARAALAEAGATLALDSALNRAAQILLERFSASSAAIEVRRRGATRFGASLAGATPAPPLRVEQLREELPAFPQRTALHDGLPDARTCLTALLVDERREAMGAATVVSSQPFSSTDLDEFRSLAGTVAGFTRPALLLEEQAWERELLSREADILAALAEAENEHDLVSGLASALQEALAADLVILMLDSAAGGAPSFVCAPAHSLSAGQWTDAKAIIASGDNRSIGERSRAAGAFTVDDLHALAETQLEAWIRDSLGMRSVAIAMRSHRWGALGLGMAAMRRTVSCWTEAERGFLARIARVFEISIERLRQAEIARDRTRRLERQANLLTTGVDLLQDLSTDEDIASACNVVSSRLREFFEADHVAFGMIDLERATRTVLGFSSDVMAAGEFSRVLGESDIATYAEAARTGRADCLSDLREERAANAAAQTLLSRGIHSLLRAPFALSDGSVGIVTLGSRQAGRYNQVDAEQLLDLCRPIGIAIDRVRLLGEASATSEMLDTKTRILAALVPGATVESVGAVFVEETRRLFGAAHTVAVVFSESRMQVAGVSTSAPELDVTAAYLGDTDPDAEWRHVVTKGQSQLVADLAAIQRAPAEDALLAGGVRCVMRAPIFDGRGRVRGLVTAGSNESDAWSEHDLGTFMELARSLALVYERAQFYRSSQERATKVQALTRLLSTLNLNAPPEEVAGLFSAQVREYLSADAVLVYAFDYEAGMRVRVALDAVDGADLSAERVPLSDSSAYLGTRDYPQSMYSSDDPSSAPEWLERAATGLGYGSIVCVRLDAAGESVGMIAAASHDPSSMGAAELEILSAVGPPLGMVLERARAVTTLRLQTQRTRAVLDILAALGPAETLEQVAGPVANALRVMYGADHCLISTVDREDVVLVAVDSSIGDWKIGDRVPLAELWDEEGPAGPVLRVVSDLATDETDVATGSVTRSSGMRSAMRVLIGTPHDPLGVVTLGSRLAGRFSETDARQLAQIVQPLAVSARYFRSKREAQLRTERLETTNRILTRLSAGGTPDHLARGFLAECRVLFDSPHGSAVQFDHDGDTGRILAVDSTLPGDHLPNEFALGDMHSARLVRQPTPHVIADARLEPGLNIRHLQLINAGIYSVIRAPLLVNDVVRGAVSMWGDGTSRFTTEDAELLGAISRPLALALEKAYALESLGESELKYRSLVAQAEEMIFLFEPVTLRLLDANSFTSATLQYEHNEITTLRLDAIMDATSEDISTNVATALADGELHLSDVRFRRRDGSLLDVDVVASVVSFGGRQAILMLARDVSERRAIMRQLVQSQKMDSLGAMAGAVAHDFNNLLTTILGFAGLLKRSTNMDTEERENLALIEDAARRAADLTGRLLSFSRGGLVRFGRVDLRTVVEDTLTLAQPTMHTGLTLECSMHESPSYIDCESGQVLESLLIIVLNARYAMPETGNILVSLGIEGSVAVVRIADDGPGMDEETRMRIFEPFYTTKPAGSGTGLGMAITYGIIQGHHGDISVESSPGVGTCFTITLPLLEPNATEPVDSFNAGEGNLVLVVDDDAMVRRTTTATLTELGYNVVEAPGGATAVEILRARPDRFSAVLLDLVMPGMTGSETFKALTAIRPDLPVVVCTGYAADSHIDTDVKRRIAGLVQKPFTAERLSRALLAAGAQPTRPARIEF